MAFMDLRRILLDVLPSSAMMVQGRELCIQNHLAKICDHLWAINAVIMDAEIRASKERDLGDWMADVGAAVNDLEVLLDGILDSAQARVVVTAWNPLFRRDIASKLKKMARRLNDLMILGGSTFNLRKEMMDAMDPRREEYFTILTDEVVGRDGIRDEIIDDLQHQKYNSDGVPIFIAIRGESGMGKTTLARMIFHHPWVRQHFHHCIWVDVFKHLFSLDFQSIARECVESITREPSGHLQDPYLQLQEALGGRRYFLVLNNLDVSRLPTKYEYERNRVNYPLLHKWYRFTHILLHAGGPGSAVIITTTQEHSSVGTLRLEEKFIIVKPCWLGGLSEDDWVKLFMRHASFIIRPNHQLLDKETASSPTPSIHDIYLLSECAKELFHKCHGQPWAAKLLGSICRYTEVSRWQHLVPGRYHFYNIDDIDHEYAALLSLHYFSSAYDRSSLYGSLLFEVTHDMEDFVHMMIVEGLLPHSCDKKVMERILPHSFVTRLWDGVGVTSQYYFMVRVGQDTQIPRQCRHLCLLFNFSDSNASTFPIALSAGAQKKLKTLILRRMEEEEEEMVLKVQKCQIAKILEAMFVHLLNLRILYLGDSTIQELPSTVGNLLHLRYLNLSHTDIRTLPGSLCKLGNLQILNLSHCEKLRKLPRQIHKIRKLQILKLAYCEKLRMLPKSVTALANLQELNLEGCYWLNQLREGFGNMKRLMELNIHKCVSLTQMPPGIGQLINLRKLSGFVVDNDLGSAPRQELQALVNLEGLHLRGLQRLLSSEVIRNMKLQDKPKLKNLTLHWEWRNMDDEAILVNLQQQILEDLQPNSALEELEMISYSGQKLPSWMTERELYVISLVEIKLINIKRCERLPSLGQLPYLKIVEISDMDSITIVDDAFYGNTDNTFPSLEELTFSEMPTLEKWKRRKRNNDELLFPWLEHLWIIQCPKFKAVEVSFGYFFHLHIWLNNNEMMLTSKFMDWHKIGFSLDLEIIGYQELQCLPQGMRNLRGIRYLTIIECRRLTSLPNWLEELEQLNSLSICNCPELAFIPEGLKKQWKTKLHIQGCPKLQR